MESTDFLKRDTKITVHETKAINLTILKPKTSMIRKTLESVKRPATHWEVAFVMHKLQRIIIIIIFILHWSTVD